MKRFLQKWGFFLAAFGLTALLAPGVRVNRVDYNSQVKPVLNKHCLACHGGVKQQGSFSLLEREAALRPTKSGKRAIIPGNPSGSEMIRRLRLHDPEERMPYKRPPLSEAEIRLLERWILEGAQWDLHWAYKTVENPTVPMPRRPWWKFWQKAPDCNWPRETMDWFVLDRLWREQLQPSPEADRITLAQRVSMDLTGLPLPEHLEKQFLSDSSVQSYPTLVDSLLASPRFGERWASSWLDLARYADTKGYERDARRFIWRYRDWVIDAFNADMPYDRFLTEQLAGDLLPQPTDKQYIATAFHRNTMTNDEGGTENEEFRVAAVLDRVNSTWTGLMSTSFNCVQCHSHPYDPFKQEEYYRFMAFFNNSRDEDTWEDYPALRHFSKPDSLRLEHLSTWMGAHLPQDKVDAVRLFLKTWQPVYYSIAADSFRNCELYDTKWLTMRNHAQARLKQVDLSGKSQLIWRFASGMEKGRWTVRLDRPDGPELFSITFAKTKDREIQSIDFQPVEGVHDLWLLYENPLLKKNEDTGLMFDWWQFTEPFPGKGAPGWAAARDSFWQLLRAPSEFTPVMIDNPADMARSTHIFERGNWLVPGAAVHPGTPAILPPMPAGAPPNRLGLAMWMTQPQHPLTARTFVNRVWEQIFGLGLVESLEDFGSQGLPAVYPELLDHLSWCFMYEDHWSLKQLLRRIVLSATYRQTVVVTDELLAKDPRNELLARGPRTRLSAEQLRDKVLAVSGLLSSKMYGPGVMPYQPEGVWKSPWNGDMWKQDTNENQYRRSIYTFIKRSSPYPMSVTFDMAQREVCVARRIKTNTPLQALVTLNDSAFVLAARSLANYSLKEGNPDNPACIAAMYRKAIGKEISPERLQILVQLYQKSVEIYIKDADSAEAFLGKAPARSNENNALSDAIATSKRAAMALVANTILNLDEFVMKS